MDIFQIDFFSGKLQRIFTCLALPGQPHSRSQGAASPEGHTTSDLRCHGSLPQLILTETKSIKKHLGASFEGAWEVKSWLQLDQGEAYSDQLIPGFESGSFKCV